MLDTLPPLLYSVGMFIRNDGMMPNDLRLLMPDDRLRLFVVV